ncbi:MAG TPA: hypothetical protein VFT04_11295 [Gemmatimonadales bacterium]|nr:hypothetical protein [Gemmatimonadales bacterium]
MLTENESRILDLLLAGDDELFAALRAQLGAAAVIARTEDPRGVIVDFEIPAELALAPVGDLDLTDVEFTIEGSDGEGFATVWVDEGALDRLEIVTIGGAWRPGMRIGDAWWTTLVEPEDDAAEPRFERVAERDLDGIRAEIARRSGPVERESAEAARAASRPADTIALPLLVPVAPMLAGLLSPSETGGDDAELVLANLPFAFDPELAAEWVGAPTADLPIASLVRYWKAWARRERPEPVIAALCAALLAGTGGRSLLDRRSVPLARELFHYLRGTGITGWPEAKAHAQEWWSRPESRELIWSTIARSLLGRLEDMTRVADTLAAQGSADTQFDDDEYEEPSLTDLEARDEPDAAAFELDALRREIADFRRELEAHHRETERLRLAKKDLRTRLERAEDEVAPLRSQVSRLERNVRLLQLLLAEARAAAEAGSPDPIPDPPEPMWEPDLLAGVTIALCTGQDRGNARHAMAEELRAVGADVRVYELNGPGVPDRFPPDTLVICDVRFASHSSTARVRNAVERGGSKLLQFKAGQGGIVRAVIGALGVE